MEQQQDLPVVGDVRRDGEDDTDLLHLDRGAWLLPRPTGAKVCRVGIENADRNFLADLNRGLAIVERDDARLGLQIREPHFLQCIEEARELELAERGREDDAERDRKSTRL